MGFTAKKVRGMRDVLPPESEKWIYIQKVMGDSASFFGFMSVRTPIAEFTELFCRSAGETSDVVQKEMYTFEDKGGRSLSLRPECTAGTLRAVIENESSLIFPVKLMYFGPCFRYEKPQSGRQREFFQFGLEIFGGSSVMADFEIIRTADYIFKKLGINDIILEINSMGCEDCRKNYRNSILNFFNEKVNKLCKICQERINKNPLRILDCKEKTCQEICSEAPSIVDFICNNCKEQFEELKSYLEITEIKYKVNAHIVRGLDYYTKTVFEFTINTNGYDLTVCGGGRYDGLSKKMGGQDLAATGFAIGIERVISIMEEQRIEFPKLKSRGLYIVCLNKESKICAVKIAEELRESGISVDLNLTEQSIKSQAKFADKMGYRYLLILGENEINKGVCNVKRMSDGIEFEIAIDDNFCDNFINKCECIL
ncbi:MAG: histidine--tRNA ligase [Oscillospiraceae bacterium]|jgi:histidyl-tRNA synthetase|nr:histidine--tRNA ligase [Oscillospiraceae bacterium]